MTPSRMVAVTVWSWLWTSALERSARRRRRRSRQSRASSSNQQSQQRAACHEEGAGELEQGDHDSEDSTVDSREDTPRWQTGGGRTPPYASPMAFLDTKRDRAAFLIFVLGLGLDLRPLALQHRADRRARPLHHVRADLPVAGANRV